MPIYKMILASDEREGKKKAWVGFDLDSTLAEYDESTFPKIGRPIPEMVELIKAYLAVGTIVKIFTARANDKDQIPKIQEWLVREAKLPKLEVTNKKDFYMIRYYDDRAVQVVPNKGRLALVAVVDDLKKMIDSLNGKIKGLKSLMNVALKYIPKKEANLIKKVL